MIYRQSFFLALALVSLGGCSKVTGIFEKDKPAPIEGDRISVLELQKSLEPDAATDGGGVVLNAPWVNDIWPQAGGYPNHSMQNIAMDAGAIKNVWKSGIGKGSSKKLPLTSQPVVASGVVYTLDADAELRAFRADNGNMIWKADVSDPQEDETVIGGGVAYASQSLFVTNGSDEVICLDPQNGEIRWRKHLPAPARAAPSATGGRVFVSTLDNRLYALNVQDGSILWEYAGVSEVAGLLGAASPAAKSDIVVSAFSSGEITALRVENGSVSWSDNLANVRRYGGGLESLSDIKAMPVLNGGLVIAISFGGKIAAIDERTGMRVWQREIGGAQTPWVAGNTVFVISEENQLVALRMQDGGIVWVRDLPRFENPEKRKDEIRWSGPVMASGRLLLAGSNEQLLQVNAVDGEIVAQMDIGKPVSIPPVIAQGTLYLLSDDGTLMAYR